MISMFCGLALYAQKSVIKRHSITPIFGFNSNRITPLTIAPSADLRIDYNNGDELRMPITLRYQYFINKGNSVGVDFLGNFNNIWLHPAYRFQNFGFLGPVVISHPGTMLGGDLHYSRTIDVKLFKLYGLLGFGGYFLRPDNTYTQDYSWYRDASPDFYEFAVAATNNKVKSFMPITNLGLGLRFKHIELGVNFQYSLSSPVKGFEYKGIQYNNNLRFSSKGCFVGYRFEF